MKILLVGEYSRLHNSLKEGLLTLGHEVTLVSDGDGFKNYPADYSVASKLFKLKLFNIPRQIIFRLFKYDVAKIENGIRFYFLLQKFKDYDVIQLINETPIKTSRRLEYHLLKKLIKQNKKAFLLCCGIDYTIVNALLNNTFTYSLLDPYLKDNNLKDKYRYIFDYQKKAHKKIHTLLYKNVNGVIASDMDYHIPLKDNPLYLGMIPNPINTDNIIYKETSSIEKTIIFLGINRWNYNQKGIFYFEEALKVIKEKYPEKIEIIIVENLPYAEYTQKLDTAHILLDQVYGYDQGYNALEAMAKGKVVFTGAEEEFMKYYNLTERVAVNALPDVQAIVNELCNLIENTEEIMAMGKRARQFVEREHNYLNIAEKYLKAWESN
ncbi:glycosyltransferase [Flavobacterium sp. MK4S-17]|uniref:glycosyltransferase family protein n=1 Tax=Flavobacterium sp. MK4S-17 TaxID=2543737 RepID=UPI00135BAB63|nr:glycosyltransferase [Flavobacterium sp. MK4S-17]